MEVTMAEHPNAALIRKAMEELNQGNPSGLMGLIADDAVFYIPGNSPVAGEYRGKEAIAGFLQHLGQLSEEPLHVDLHYILTGGDEHVVAVWTAHAARKGITYEGIAGYIFRVRDQQIVEGRNLQADQDAVDQFWSA